MKIIVQRGVGDKPGPDIIDPLLTTELVCRERGRQAIDSSESKVIEQGNCPLLPYMETGKVTQVSLSDTVFIGKVTGYSFTIDMSPFSQSSSVNIKRVRRDE